MTTWTDEKQVYFVNEIPDYRALIKHRTSQPTSTIKTDFANYLYNTYSLLQEHTISAIEQHITYMDKLLSGEFNGFIPQNDEKFIGTISHKK